MERFNTCKYYLVFMLMIISSSYAHLSGWTLSSAQRYAQQTRELPPLQEGYAAFNPDYSSWYKEQQPSLVSSVLEFIGLYRPEWSVKTFTSLLDSVLTIQEKKGWSDEQSLVLQAEKGAEFFIVGPLYGSFHSLVRIVSAWKEKGYIDDNLKLRKASTRIVFLGNVIDGSPYILETLSLVLALMEANPMQLFYLQGKHEFSDYWRGYGLQQEIEMRIQDYSLYQKVAAFYKTLSPKLFLVGSETDKDLILLAGRAAEEVALDAACIRKVHTFPAGKPISCLEQTKGSNGHAQALITGENRLMSFSKHPGLVLAPSESGTITWAIFSAPNAIFQRDFNFYYDAYAILTIGASLKKSVLTLYHQDVREQTGFQEGASYDVLTGKSLMAPKRKGDSRESLLAPKAREIAQCAKEKPLERRKITDGENPIYIGCSLDLSKGASAIGKPLKTGISLCVNWVNLHGGIKGRPLQVVFMDDEYSPEKARENVESFMKKYKSSLFLCNLGSPTLQSCLDLMKQNKIFVFFPATGAPIFRKPDLLGVVHWRGSYRGEGAVLVRYMMEKRHVKTFGFLYQNDVFGQGCLEGAQEVLKKAGITNAIAAPYERNTTSFKTQIEKLKAAEVSGIGFFSTSIAAMEFIRQAGVDFFLGRKVFGISDLGDESFQLFAKELGLELVVAQDVPNPRTSDLPIVKQFRTALYQQGYMQENVFQLEGYIGARIMVDILQKAAPEISHDAINAVLKGMKKYPFLGFTFTFNPERREIANLLWLDTGEPEWLMQSVEI